ncbi:motility associated factor glycosyltransferase family protein [Clostridium prolinivorans]|uniref:motility associated factor glycosyltransferase family protein n=1 Tax=Clostridium prolinivorans TaxID=2769420 RepID=UPI000FD7B2C2|nr:6-hydroxymethylpterin diphosphokinase MptE-like protein [Clostridium prolinivorans]
MLNSFYLDWSLDNFPILRVNIDGKLNYIGSLYNMKKEIDIIQNTIKNTSTSKSIVVFGGANGVWVNDIDYITESKEIVIVEPNKELFNKLISNKFNIKNNIVRVVCMEDENFYQNLLSSVSKNSFEILVFSNYDIVFKEQFKEFLDKVIFMYNDKKLMENTQKYFVEDWFVNFLNNLTYINDFERVDSYKNIFKGKPAIVVSAGPSLEKNLKYLKGNEDKFIIITGARTLNTLIKEGINADFTCIIDSSKEMYDVFKHSLDSEVPLLTIDTGNTEIIRKYKGKKILFNSKDFINASRYLLDFKMDLLFQGGSVAHTCTSFAKLLGCDPIIFIGQDLAYTNNKLHADNAVIEGENNDIKDTGIYIKGVVEEKVLTNHDLNMFRERLETMIRIYSDTTFINCTEGGAHIEGTEIKTLKETIDEFNTSIDKNLIKKDNRINLDINKLLGKLKNIYNEIDNMISLCNESIKINSQLKYLYVDGRNKYNKALKRLDEIDSYFKNNKEVMYIFESLVEVINYELSQEFEDKEISKCESETDKIIIISEKGKWLYNKFKEMFEFSKPIIVQTIEKMEESL